MNTVFYGGLSEGPTETLGHYHTLQEVYSSEEPLCRRTGQITPPPRRRTV